MQDCIWVWCSLNSEVIRWRYRRKEGRGEIGIDKRKEKQNSERKRERQGTRHVHHFLTLLWMASKVRCAGLFSSETDSQPLPMWRERRQREREKSDERQVFFFWLHEGMDFQKNQTNMIKLILTWFTILIYMDKHLITVTSPKDTDNNTDTKKVNQDFIW